MRRHSLLIRTVLSVSVTLLVASCDTSTTDVAPLEITTTSLPDAVAALPYAATLSASGAGGGPYTRTLVPSSDALPEGLELEADGTVSGLPILNGTTSFTVAVSADGSTDEAELSITIATECHIEDYSGLEGYWRLDEETLAEGDDVADGSDRNRSGTVVAGEATDNEVSGQVDGAIELDGTSDHVR